MDQQGERFDPQTILFTTFPAITSLQSELVKLLFFYRPFDDFLSEYFFLCSLSFSSSFILLSSFFFICCCSCCYCLPHDNVSFVCLELLKFILEIKILTPFSAISVPLLSKMNFEWRDVVDDERKIPDKEYMNLTSMDSTLYEINLSNTLKSTFEPNVCQEIVLTRTDMNQKS